MDNNIKPYSEIVSYLAKNKIKHQFQNGGMAKRNLTLLSIIKNSQKVKIFGNDFYNEDSKELIKKLNLFVEGGKDLKILLTNFNIKDVFYKFVNQQFCLGNIEAKISSRKYSLKRMGKANFILGDNSKYAVLYTPEGKPQTIGDFNDKEQFEWFNDFFEETFNNPKYSKPLK